MAALEIPYRLSLIRALALVALAVSAALTADNLFSEAHLCSFDESCEAVAASWFARPFGVPLSLIGVVVFAILFALSVVPSPKARRALSWLAVLAGVGGLGLIAVQALVIGRLCPFCLVVDVAALLLGAVAISGKQAELPDEGGSAIRLVWLVCGGVVLSMAVVVGAWQGGDGGEEAPVPPQVAERWVKDKVNVVAISDFECRFCRRLYPALMEFVKEQGDRIHFALIPVATPGHPQSKVVVRAYFCAERQGKGRAMAELLMNIPTFTPALCDDLAVQAGVDPSSYQACLLDEAIDKNLDAAWVKEAHPRGLPAVWVQNRKFESLTPDTARETLREAVRKAQHRLNQPPGD